MYLAMLVAKPFAVNPSGNGGWPINLQGRDKSFGPVHGLAPVPSPLALLTSPLSRAPSRRLANQGCRAVVVYVRVWLKSSMVCPCTGLYSSHASRVALKELSSLGSCRTTLVRRSHATIIASAQVSCRRPLLERAPAQPSST